MNRGLAPARSDGHDDLDEVGAVRRGPARSAGFHAGPPMVAARVRLGRTTDSGA